MSNILTAVANCFDVLGGHLAFSNIGHCKGVFSFVQRAELLLLVALLKREGMLVPFEDQTRLNNIDSTSTRRCPWSKATAGAYEE